ncbi:DinB family protein [Flavobacterium sp. ZS1P14]|uniref:DinB family protein n=1 Tax=Flavobacterium sp. ZS1P14 TaxID=3401729 RepID=UPI003AAA5D6F
MESTFKIWTANRTIFLTFLEQYSLEQLNTIPQGFGNNIIWNIGHVVVSQQGLVYRRSKVPVCISEELFERYKNGTKPTGTTTQIEIDELKKLLISLVEKTKIDFKNEKFISYDAFTTGIGFHLSSVKEAIEYNNYHEALHLGFIMNIRKFI